MGPVWGTPGPGGYGAILDFCGHQKELSGGFRLTTNNRMELLAVIEGLSALKQPCNVTLYSDSQYVVAGDGSRLATRVEGEGLAAQGQEAGGQPGPLGKAAGLV